MKTVRAKFRLNQKNQNEAGFSLEFWPVTSGSEENERFYKYTPGGKIEMSTINADAAAMFEVGKCYYVDFTPAE